MIRILCMGDTHIGSGTEYGTTPYGPGSRLDDQALVLEEILDIATSERVNVILHAGDVFHRAKPTPAELRVWQVFVEHLPCPMLVIPGNHDYASADQPIALELFPSVMLQKAPTVVPLVGTACVATLPWTPPARLAAQLDGYDRDDLHQRLAELLVQTAAGLRAQCPSGRPAILMAHWSVSGAVSASGQDVALFRETILPLHELEAQGWDAIVLGHIHKHQFLGPMTFYTGSCPKVDFGETGSHGVTILDVQPSMGVAQRFVAVPDRRFVTLDADLTALGTSGLAYVDLGLQVPGDDVQEAVVRVRYTATPEQARRVDHAAIRQALLAAGAHRVYAIQPNIVRADRARVDAIDETLDEASALDLYLTHQDVAEPLAGRVRDATRDYLTEARA